MPPRHRPVTVRPCARISCAAALERRRPARCRARARSRRCRGARSRRPAARSDHGLAPSSRLIDSSRARSLRQVAHHACDAVDAAMHARACAPAAQLGIGEQPGGVGEAEQLGEMQGRARALLAADHGEVILQAVEIGHEHHAGLVEARRRLEDVARQRHGRRQDVVEGLRVAARRARRAPPRPPARWRRRCRAARRNSPRASPAISSA